MAINYTVNNSRAKLPGKPSFVLQSVAFCRVIIAIAGQMNFSVIDSGLTPVNGVNNSRAKLPGKPRAIRWLKRWTPTFSEDLSARYPAPRRQHDCRRVMTDVCWTKYNLPFSPLYCAASGLGSQRQIPSPLAAQYSGENGRLYFVQQTSVITRLQSCCRAFLVKDITKTIHEGLVKHLNFYRDLFSYIFPSPGRAAAGDGKI
jgi:hypothetical protein